MITGLSCWNFSASAHQFFIFRREKRMRLSWYECVLRVIAVNVWPEKLPGLSSNILGGGWGIEEGSSWTPGLILNFYHFGEGIRQWPMACGFSEGSSSSAKLTYYCYCLMFFQQRSKGILLGVVGTDVPVKELLKTIPKYKVTCHLFKSQGPNVQDNFT